MDMKRYKMLRIYASSTDRVKHTSLHETLAFAARRYGMAGVTVYKGMMGYGASSEIFSNKFWELSDKVPVVIELIDEVEKIEHFFQRIRPWLEQLPKGCLAVTTDVEVLLQQRGRKSEEEEAD